MYGKIFDSIYDGTLRTNWQALVTFQQLIILADKSGVVDMTPHAIHGRTGIPMEIIEAGLDHLSKPDPYSRSNEEEGRRIVLIDDCRPWGWRLVNHGYYNRLRSMEEKREADRERAAAKRNTVNKGMSQNVADSRGTSHGVAEIAPITVAVPIAVTVPNTIQELNSVGLTPDLSLKKKFKKPKVVDVQIYCRERSNNVDPSTFIDFYESNGWKVGKNPMKDWRAAIRTWEKRNQNGGHNAKPSKLQQAAAAIRASHLHRATDVQDVGEEPRLRAISSRLASGNPGDD